MWAQGEQLLPWPLSTNLCRFDKNMDISTAGYLESTYQGPCFLWGALEISVGKTEYLLPRELLKGNFLQEAYLQGSSTCLLNNLLQVFRLKKVIMLKIFEMPSDQWSPWRVTINMAGTRNNLWRGKITTPVLVMVVTKDVFPPKKHGSWTHSIYKI